MPTVFQHCIWKRFHSDTTENIIKYFQWFPYYYIIIIVFCLIALPNEKKNDSWRTKSKFFSVWLYTTCTCSQSHASHRLCTCESSKRMQLALVSKRMSFKRVLGKNIHISKINIKNAWEGTNSIRYMNFATFYDTINNFEYKFKVHDNSSWKTQLSLKF